MTPAWQEIASHAITWYIMSVNKSDLQKLLAKHQEKTERYLGALKEDYDHKLDSVLEYVEDIPKMKRQLAELPAIKEQLAELPAIKEQLAELPAIKEQLAILPEIKETQDMMFDTIGEMAEDITIIKEDVKDHEQRLQKIEMR
jgi:gas vesicle protein